MSESRLVAFLEAVIEIEERDADATRLSAFVFGRFPAAPARQPSLTLALAGDGPEKFALWRDGSEVYRATPAGAAIRLLLAEATHALVARAGPALLLHAAAVDRNGRGFLLPAGSGAGKSTLAAWLDDQGFACLSDELAGIADDKPCLAAFPRPLCLEPDAVGVLAGPLERARRAGRLIESPEGPLVAGATRVPAHPVPLRRIIFPRYVPGSSARLLPLSKGNAVLMLMQTLVRTPPDRGFATTAGLARDIPAFELRHGGLDAGGDTILAALDDVVREMAMVQSAG